jgi:hypothetical protein
MAQADKQAKPHRRSAEAEAYRKLYGFRSEKFQTEALQRQFSAR